MIKLQRGYSRKRPMKALLSAANAESVDGDTMRRKKKSKCNLTCAERESIVQSVKTDLLSHREAGQKHNVSP